jgi:hypothetical protein
MSIGVAGQNKDLDAGIGEWMEGQIDYAILHRAVLTAIWLEDTTLLIQGCFIETPFAIQFKFTFKEDQVFMAYKINVGFEETKWNIVSGK